MIDLKRLIEIYKVAGEFHRAIRHSQLEEFLNSLPKDKFDVDLLGSSVEGRNIYSVTFGEGKTRVLLWSQMHGDEPTATLALIDLLSYLNKNYNDELNELRNRLKIRIIPMLNPDGAERMTRENALGIDINRDALKLASPESRILMNELTNFKPEFAFNLHDQDIRWKAGDSKYPASISLLAPPPNHSKEITIARRRAIQLVSELFNELKGVIPNSVAKYSDEHEPRSFGDTAAAMNISTILIEAGRVKDDYEKSFLRKLNFALFFYALHSIATKSFSKYDDKIYNQIPFNDGNYFDLIIRNVEYASGNGRYKMDIGIDREYQFIPEMNSEILSSSITSVGDLSNTFGLEEIDASNYELIPPKVYDGEIKNNNKERLWELIKEGYLIVRQPERSDNEDLLLTTIQSNSFVFKILPGQPADFILKGGEDISIINGYPVKRKEELTRVKRIIKKPQQ